MTSAGKGRASGKHVDPPLKVTQSEALHSINHLYQSAVQSAIRCSITKNSLGDSIQRVVQLQGLARKATLRLDCSLRRSMCQKCHVPLLPGLTSTIRVRTIAPISRALEVQCRLCTLKRRQIATPSRKEYSNKIAARNRKKAARKLKLKLASYSPAVTKWNASNAQMAPSADSRKEEPAKDKKWSQRARRRAGRIKVQMLRADLQSETDANPLQLERNTSRSKAIPLPRYASRIKGEKGWESSLEKSEMSSHERDALMLLRGNHLLTSGVGRGGFVGQVEAAL
jgi:RNase P subunit RPR2